MFKYVQVCSSALSKSITLRHISSASARRWHFFFFFARAARHLAHDVPNVGVVHGVALDRSRVPVEDVHQVSLLAVFEHQIQLVDLTIDRTRASQERTARRL